MMRLLPSLQLFKHHTITTLFFCFICLSAIFMMMNSKLVFDSVLTNGHAICKPSEQEHCFSRHQLPSYRKKRPYKPTPYLKSKLQNYEQLHAQCGPHSVHYSLTLRNLKTLSNVDQELANPCKYLIWEPANGLGNRMLSLASAFLYAILQNRVLLVAFEADMHGLFCEPFPNSSWLLPENFPFRDDRWSAVPRFNKSWTNNILDDVSQLPTFVYLDVKYGKVGYSDRQHFHCNATQFILQKIPVVILKSDQYFVPSMFMMPSFKEELDQMFPDKSAVFYHLGQYLFHPSNEAWELITQFYDANLSKADEKVGLQIRIFDYSPQITHQEIMERILSCVQINDILPPLENNMLTSMRSLNKSAKSKSVFVASLYPEFSEQLRSLYRSKPAVTGEVIRVYQASHEKIQKFDDCLHNLKALADIYLLSLCDVLVTSPMSTFGYVAQSLGGVTPWIMGNLGTKVITNSTCKRGFTPEPCFQYPISYDCERKKATHRLSEMSPYLTQCEDFRWAVKLTNV